MKIQMTRNFTLDKHEVAAAIRDYLITVQHENLMDVKSVNMSSYEELGNFAGLIVEVKDLQSEKM